MTQLTVVDCAKDVTTRARPFTSLGDLTNPNKGGGDPRKINDLEYRRGGRKKVCQVQNVAVRCRKSAVFGGFLVLF